MAVLRVGMEGQGVRVGVEAWVARAGGYQVRQVYISSSCRPTYKNPCVDFTVTLAV